MIVRIIRGHSPKWYSSEIGKVFDVVKSLEYEDNYSLGDGRLIRKEDAVVIDNTVSSLIKLCDFKMDAEMDEGGFWVTITLFLPRIAIKLSSYDTEDLLTKANEIALMYGQEG